MYLICERGFESLLNALQYALRQNEDPDGIVTADEALQMLPFEVLRFGTDVAAASVFAARIQRCSREAYAMLCVASLSGDENIPMTMLRFLRAVRTHGGAWITNYADPAMRDMQMAVKRVLHERHRFQGMLRFAELSDGTFYAAYAPDHDITALIAPHFAARIPRPWIIHDTERRCAAIHENGRWDIVDAELCSDIVYSEAEEEYRAIWRRYYREIAIPERKNHRLRNHFLPRRYWKHLTELND